MAYVQDDAYKLEVVDLSDDTAVNSAATNSQTLQPTAGFIYEIVGIDYLSAAPIGASSGTQVLQILGYDGSAYNSNLAQITGPFNDSIDIWVSMFLGATSEYPSGDTAQSYMLNSGILIASNSYPISFKYTNSTDVQKTGTRTLIVRVKVKREAL